MLAWISDFVCILKFEIHLMTSIRQIIHDFNDMFVQYVTFAICIGLNFTCKTCCHSCRISAAESLEKL